MTDQVAENIWVNVTEAAEITGYNRDHVRKLARDNWSLPESERKIQIKRHSNGYMVWLPALVEYIEKYGSGPFKKRKLE